MIKMAAKKTNKAKKEETNHVSNNTVGTAVTRGRAFEGFVVKKFPMRVVIEMERTVYVQKYERFFKKKMRMHARLPQGMDVQLGDLVRVRECRPLSKIIHAIVVEKIRGTGTPGQENKA